MQSLGGGQRLLPKNPQFLRASVPCLLTRGPSQKLKFLKADKKYKKSVHKQFWGILFSLEVWTPFTLAVTVLAFNTCLSCK